MFLALLIISRNSSLSSSGTFSKTRYLNLDPNQCIVFEDSKNGVLSAKSGGFFTYGVGNIDLLNFADICIKDLTEYKWF